MTQRSCCVPGCLVKLEDGVLLHRFPNPSNSAQIERFRTWVMKIGGDIIGEDNTYIYRNRKVCHRHFEKIYIFPNKKLTSLAIPTLHIPGVHISGRKMCKSQTIEPAVECGTKTNLGLPSTSAQMDTCIPLEPDVCKVSLQKSHTAEPPIIVADGNINPPSTPAQVIPSKTGIKIALIQLAVGMDKKQNLCAAVQQILKAKEKGAQLVALPEFFNAPYGTKYFKEYAEPIPNGESSQALRMAAMETGLCVVGGTMPERCGDELYNTCTVWDGCGNLIAQHRKVHLFDIDIPGKITFKESDVLSAGDHITTFEFMGIKIGLGICYDLRFFEMAQVMSKEGCSVLIYPGAFNTTTGPKHWELLARARANDLQLWVALVSPARDPAADYVAWGHTMLVDPWATVLHQLDDKPGMLCAEIDLQMVEEVRSQIPIRSQRRTDIYDTIYHSA